MRIVLDLQGAQAGNAHRGIGRYSLALAQAMLRLGRGHEFFIALNGAFPDSIDRLRDEFDGLLPQDRIRVWTPPRALDTPGARRAAEKLRESFLTHLRPDVVHLSSLFEGPNDNTVTSCGRFTAVPTAVTLYDLIPHQYPELYLADGQAHAAYLRKLDDLQRAQLWLAISDASRQEAIARLEAPVAGCVNIGTAAGAHFVPGAPDPAMAQALLARLGLDRPFVMYTGGIDVRKNIEGLIRAFALLPPALRQSHQLAIVCSASDASREALEREAARAGLEPGALVMTGFVPEADLVALYQLCRLFVFPSWHEGFGLPALEAMQCGAPVLASNTSSLPEVVGRADALFDPRDDRDIARLMTQALGDESILSALRDHGLTQAGQFSWEKSAGLALHAMEALNTSAAAAVQPSGSARANGRPRLAYVSPLPPERSGIADYSAELLPELARYYDIDVIVSQPRISDPWIAGNCAVRTADWLLANHQACDRVLYHFGNSEYHAHMFDLLAQVPGVVILHDFFLSGVVAHREATMGFVHSWVRALYHAHGYAAAARRYVPGKSGELVAELPCNFEVLRDSVGVIAHSPHTQELATHWYGGNDPARWAQIPLLRTTAPPPRPREELLWELGLPADAFLVCSFGLLGRTKMNDRLLAAWCASALAADPRCHLVFVGQAHQDAFGREMEEAIARTGQGRIKITGWASAQTFRDYLDAADLAVQLRTMSRGETSASVLDTMNHGLATIVNANGAMAHLPRDAVHMLPDEFADEELVEALELLWRDGSRRRALGDRGRAVIAAEHSPRHCARQYHTALEGFYAAQAGDRDALVDEIANFELPDATATERRNFLAAVADTFPRRTSARQLFVDVSELVQRDSASGIQRVVKNMLRELIDHPPQGFRIEPVYAVGGQLGYRYARKFTLGLLNSPQDGLTDETVEPQAGDVFLGLDLQTVIVREQVAFFDRLRAVGVRSYMVVYDLLPLLLPQHFDGGGGARHDAWLRVAAQFDGAICISRAVADELHHWLETTQPERSRRVPLRIGWFHLGADISNALPSSGMPEDAPAVLAHLSEGTTFLMVGTVEPRKGHRQVLDAFELLWAQGHQVNLVIAGREGWMVAPLVERLRSHAERGKRLFWLEGVSDEYLQAVYTASDCLIAASEGEGFGLPLIEAAQHGVPMIARDLPVFREVAQEHAHYFAGDQAQPLADALVRWLELWRAGTEPRPEGLAWQTWEQSAQQLKRVLLQEEWYRQWTRSGC